MAHIITSIQSLASKDHISQKGTMQSSSRNDIFSRWRSPLFSDFLETKNGSVSIEVPNDGLYGFIFGREKHNGIFELNVRKAEKRGEPNKAAGFSGDSDGNESKDESSSVHCGCTYRASFTTRCEEVTETMALPMVSPSSRQKLLGSTRIAKVVYLPEGTKVMVENIKFCKMGNECKWAWGLVLEKNYGDSTSSRGRNRDINQSNEANVTDPPFKKPRSDEYGDQDFGTTPKKDIFPPELSLNPSGIGKKTLLCSLCCKKCSNAHAVRNHCIGFHAPKLGEDGTDEFDDLIGPKLFRTPLNTAYEDDDIVIVVKPQGVPVQGSGKWTLINSDLLMPFRSKMQRDGDLAKPRITHRLDSATGGLLVVAKTYKAERTVKELFATKQCRKRYRAIVFGKLVQNEHEHSQLEDKDEESGDSAYAGMGVINASLQGGKDSITRYKIVSYSPCNHPIANGFITTVDLYPLTGRKHQLRRHLKMIGHPIVGDMRYGPYDASQKASLKCHGATTTNDMNMDDLSAEKNPHGRMCLWALEITFPHPLSKESVTAKIDEPEWYGKLRAMYESASSST